MSRAQAVCRLTAAVSLLAACFPLSASAQQYVFRPELAYDVQQYPGAAESGDFNNDRIPDLVVVTGSNGQVRVLLGTGDGTFGPGIAYTNVGQASDVKVADVNGDGNLDALVSGGSSGYLSVLMGNGQGAFTSRAEYATALGSRGLALGDLNGDGRVDAVTANEFASSVSVLLGAQPGPFQPAVNVTVGTGPVHVAIGDLTGDGKADVAVTMTGVESLVVLPGNGAGGFGAPLNYQTWARPQDVALGDFNGDRRLDAVVTLVEALQDGRNAICVFLATPGGLNATFVTAKNKAVRVRVGDIERDSRLDIITIGIQEASLYPGRGDGTFGTRTDVDTELHLDGLVLADFNLDQYPDFSYSARAADKHRVRVAIPATPSGFAPPMSFAVGAWPYRAAKADLNGDGRIDLVTANRTGNSITVLVSRGDGGFSSRADYPAGDFPCGIAVGDINGDQRPDLVVVNANSQNLSLLINNGGGGFTPLPSIAPTQPASCDVALADVNRDSRADLVLSSPISQVSIMLGRGDATFQPAVAYYVSTFNVAGLDVGDLNGDGAPDVVAGGSAARVSVLINDGSGRFSETWARNIACGTPSLGDVNRDGKLDIVMGDCVGTNIFVALGAGDGSFGTANAFAGPYWPSFVDLADHNGDGILDITATTLRIGEGAVSVLNGRGDGTFAPQIVVPFDSSIWGAYLVPLRPGSASDLVVLGGSANNAVMVLLRRNQ